MLSEERFSKKNMTMVAWSWHSFTPFFQVMSNPIGEGPRICDWSNQSNRMLRRYIYCIQIKNLKKRNQHKAFLRKKSHLLENNQRRRQQQWRHGLSLGGCGALRSATPAVEETEHHELVHLCAAAVTQKWHHHEWVNATPASFVVS